ncbi:MAG: hypothetical protein IJZ26_02935 [Clostridia bacterium]|nr:hypothetical protein [Clostridia bacterium]
MINIFYCTDNKLFTQQLMSVITLVNNTNEALNIINLTVEVPEYKKFSKKTTEAQDKYIENIVKAKNPESKWQSLDVSDLFRKHLLKGVNMENKFYSMFVTVRLLAHLIPELGDKAIYLDSDTIISGDIKELWDLDITNYHIAGRRDSGRPGFKYLQSGVMLLNLKSIREEGIFARACDMIVNEKIGVYLDMTAINKAIPNKKKKVFDKKFNCYKYKKNNVIHHVCALREGKFPLIGKWWHRIKIDELDLLKKYQPEYAHLVDDMYKRMAENPELF